jgi:uncharacterized protein YdeI (YjbR/CyaY-like superfamily)
MRDNFYTDNSNIPTKAKTFTPKSLADWRNWLEKNHLKENKVIFIKYKKHTGQPIIYNADAMKEAICFGWIDTTTKRVDEDRYSQTYVKRGKNSRWSLNTLKYGKELLKEGKMSEFGIKMYKEGLRKKAFDAHVPTNPDIPQELKDALSKNSKAKDFFEKLPPSAKKMCYRRIIYPKREETRLKRIRELIQMCEAGRRY